MGHSRHMGCHLLACRIEDIDLEAARFRDIERTDLPAASGSKNVLRTGHENAGATGLAPHALVARARLRPVIVARVKFPVVDPQLAVKEKQLLQPGMRVSGILDARQQTHQHAHAVSLRIGRHQLAEDSGRYFLPFGFVPLLVRRDHGVLACFSRDAAREAFVQR